MQISIVVNGETIGLGRKMSKILSDMGHIVEYIPLEDTHIVTCYNCEYCKYKTFRKCVNSDDIDFLYSKIVDADILIVMSRLIYGTYDIQ